MFFWFNVCFKKVLSSLRDSPNDEGQQVDNGEQ